MNSGKPTTLVLPARLLADVLSTDEDSRRTEVLKAAGSVVALADTFDENSFDANSFDALSPEAGWLICRDCIFQRIPGGQWAALKEFQRNGPPSREAAASFSWWLRFSGRSPEHVVVFVDDQAQWLAGDWRVVLSASASESIKRQVQGRDAKQRAKQFYCAAESGWMGWQRGLTWFGASALAAPDGEEAGAPSGRSRLGATVVAPDRTFFRVWAPRRKQVAVQWRDSSTTSPQLAQLTRDADGYHTGYAPIGVGAEYLYSLDTHLFRPDPASRFQPRSVHEHSMVTAPTTFPWTDQHWKGVHKQDLVIYELHIGAFSSRGDYRGVVERLPYLKDLGVTAIELLPVAQTPGRWNWGYDGVAIFAPDNSYGHPDDLKALVDACHREGIAVLLDVVYNHLGPEGNYLNEFGPYFSKKHHTPWGGAFNFDGWLSEHVRRLVVENAVYWLDEFHLDGLRLDAVHFMFDDSQPTILSEIRSAAAQCGVTPHGPREIHLIAEANMFDEALLTRDADQQPYDAIWCDCLMHSIYSLGAPDLNLTYREFRGAADIDEALRHGYLYEMPASSATDDRPEVTRTLLEHRASRHQHGDLRHLQSLVIALQTHDSVGNHPHGKRIHHLTSVEFQRAAATLVLLYPAIPMIFMGEESSIEAPFPFFADFGDSQLRANVDRGRAREYPQHEWDGAPVPSDPRAFYGAKCELDAADVASDPATLQWYQRLIKLRKEGVARNWLTPERLHVSSDIDHGAFMLRYELDDGCYWIVSRLTSPQGDSRLWQFPHRGALIMDSRQAGEATASPFQLEANHALVVRS